jgi:predicted nucleic acid-binding protein
VSGFDIDAAMRWARFDPQRTLAYRSDAQLPFASNADVGSRTLLLDACVYIDQLHANSPELLTQLVTARHANHSIIAIVELMHAVGALDPRESRTSTTSAEIRNLIKRVPWHRIFTPDADTLGRAGLLAGVVCRLQGYGSERRMRALHDCVLYLQALKMGLTVLTRDVADFDVLSQLLPAGRVLFYRRKDGLSV